MILFRTFKEDAESESESECCKERMANPRKIWKTFREKNPLEKFYLG